MTPVIVLLEAVLLSHQPSRSTRGKACHPCQGAEALGVRSGIHIYALEANLTAGCLWDAWAQLLLVTGIDGL